HRVEECIAMIEGAAGAGLPQAAVRVLARRRPPAAADVLLRFLPAAQDEQVEVEITTALAVLGVDGGKAGPELRAALRDPEPLRRAVAAAVIGGLRDPGQRTLVRALLQDPDLTVRFQAAQALFSAREKAALPVLVALLRDGPPNLAFQAESLLLHVA